MFRADEIDGVGAVQLRASGSAKWTRVRADLSASVAEMDWGVATPITDALSRAAWSGPFGYMPQRLAEELAIACAELQARVFGWSVDPRRIQPVGDVIAALEMTIEIFTEPGTPVTVMTPAYMPFLIAPEKIARGVIEVPMRNEAGGWTMDLEGISKALESGSRLVVLCNPHNPIGKVYRREELRRLAELVDAYDAHVFADEIHALLTYDDATHVPYASVSERAGAHSITATSASKAWNIPGLKCAQAILPAAEVVDRWDGSRHSATRGASTFGAIATVAAYREGLQWLNDVRGYLRRNRTILYELLAERVPQLRSLPPDGTYLSWLDCRALGWGDHPAGAFLSGGGVCLTDGALCGSAGRGHVRLNFATPTPVLREVVQAMARAIDVVGAH